MLKKIISGGQTGSDRGGLDAAIESGFPVGGSCPVGRKAEDGPISDKYNLTEIGGGYRQRNKQNVIDSDGTAIFYSGYLQGGTEITVLFCMREKKPYKLVDIEVVDPGRAVELLANFIDEFDIKILNVAGPRSSKCPRIYGYVKQVFKAVLQQRIK